ncbi:hypothetical protein [Desulfotomaculum copahuensis]|nr:hypothetical protein [Desulfotomaculum copahuensis]
MRNVTWKSVAGKHCAYLESGFGGHRKKSPALKDIYLGNTPERAAARLRRLVGDNEEYFHLVTELYRKRPGRKPPVNEREKVVRALRRLAARYKDEEVQAVLQQALVALETDDAAGSDES